MTWITTILARFEHVRPLTWVTLGVLSVTFGMIAHIAWQHRPRESTKWVAMLAPYTDPSSGTTEYRRAGPLIPVDDSPPIIHVVIRVGGYFALYGLPVGLWGLVAWRSHNAISDWIAFTAVVLTQFFFTPLYMFHCITDNGRYIYPIPFPFGRGAAVMWVSGFVVGLPMLLYNWYRRRKTDSVDNYDARRLTGHG